MNKKEAESVFRFRQTLVDNLDKITGAIKSSKKSNISNQGQLDLFSVGLEDAKQTPKLNEYKGRIDLIECVRMEMDLLGVPVIYNPLNGLEIYNELYCTHEVSDLLEMNKDTKGIIIMDWITEIEHKISKNNKPYIKIYTSLFGAENYMFLWGQNYKRLISQVFVNEIFLFSLDFKCGNKDFSRETISIEHLKNIKNIDIESEYDRLIANSKTSSLNEHWMFNNRQEYIKRLKLYMKKLQK